MAVGLTAAATMIISACSSSKGSGSNGPSGERQQPERLGTRTCRAAFNAATIGFVNTSTKTGGSLNLVATGDCDSWDPANTYYGWCWNMQRLFTRTLVGYSHDPRRQQRRHRARPGHCPGRAQRRLHPVDLPPEGRQVGERPAGHLQGDQVRHRARLRDRPVQPGPGLVLPVPAGQVRRQGQPGLPGPYKDKTGGLDQITTPDDKTIVFKLNTSTPDFDYLMTLPASAPVPLAENGANSGAKYTLHPLSDGPFKFQSYTPEQKVVWVRNPNWDQSTDKIRTPQGRQDHAEHQHQRRRQRQAAAGRYRRRDR